MNGLPLLPDAEWLETNGLGGFALSTVSGRNARRYHGLLVTATSPPTGRAVLLGKLEETLVLGEERFDLAVNRYGGRLHPRGDLHLRAFRVDPLPTWEFEVGDVRLRRTFFLVHGEATAVVCWELLSEAEGAIRLEVRPLLVYRGHHELRGPATPCDPAVWQEDGAVRLRPCVDLPDLRLAHDAESVTETFFWYRGLEYDLDRERGFEYTEDLFSPLSFSWDLSMRAEATKLSQNSPSLNPRPPPTMMASGSSTLTSQAAAAPSASPPEPTTCAASLSPLAAAASTFSPVSAPAARR